MPGVRIPGTMIPTLGVVSVDASAEVEVMRGSGLTVTNDGSIDHECQQGHLVCSGVVLQQSSGVVVADGSVHRTLSNSSTDSGGDSKSLEKHDCDNIECDEMFLLVFVL